MPKSHRFILRLVARTAAVWLALAAGGVTLADEFSPAALPAAKEAASPERIDQLVKQLGDKDYFVRQRAQDELARLGFEAFDALNAATTNDDLEISSRAKYLLRLMRVEWTSKNDPPAVKDCLRDYEAQDPKSRVLRMKTLAALPDGQGAMALCRLVRFEKSLPLSKRAAVELLLGPTSQSPKTSAAVGDMLHGCDRPGAKWLRAWGRLMAGPDDEALVEWRRLVAEEIGSNDAGNGEPSGEIAAGLVRVLILQLKKVGKINEAMTETRRLVELERGNPETMAELLEWLLEQKAWKAVDELAQRFAPRFAVEPGLLYVLAQAYAEQGDKHRAEDTAKRASELFPGKQPTQLIHHVMVAEYLREQGQFPWARREFEHVIKEAGDSDNDELRVMAQAALAEMLHDQGEDLDAAKVFEKLVEAIDGGKVTEAELGERKPGEIRARMHFFSACDGEAKNDTAKRREHLDKAMKADPTDVDVLIACYRLPEQTPEYHAKIVGLIKKSAAVAREQIAESPEDATPYNQIAWLIGNTEGDLDEALKCSQKSLELAQKSAEMPRNSAEVILRSSVLKSREGGLRDTLARVYFAKGDLDNAVKQQTKAAELAPHSGLIRRQIEFFRKQQEEKEKS